MSLVNVKDKEVVVPGEELATGMDFLPSIGTFREDDKIISSQLGIANITGRVIKVIPLKGRYVPKAGDVVIGKVVNMSFSNWFVDVGYAYEAVLSLKDATSDYVEKGADLSKFFDFGEFIITKITNVSKSNMIDLTMRGPGLRKVKGGKIIYVDSLKVPRIIGKQGSMISIVKEKTNCRITVGQNGWVWVLGDDLKMEIIATKAIKKIEENAHKSGLTESIKKFLNEECNLK